MTLGMGLVPLKTNRLFGLVQQGIRANIVKFLLLDQQILASSESSQVPTKSRPEYFIKRFSCSTQSHTQVTEFILSCDLSSVRRYKRF